YSIPKSSNVSIKVYDISGKFISEIVNKFHSAGNYEASFSGEDLSSGVYFYRIEAGELSQTKRMMLLK
ncbi:MAG TPA: T9SS type A sorting domain-containing protein, partial [Ignavibacteria bacterium]|nr:T9SS type A sorting domain-containing protein [Ignavibacteria bacterium]